MAEEIGDRVMEDQGFASAIEYYTTAGARQKRANAYGGNHQWDLAEADWLHFQSRPASRFFREAGRWRQAAEFGLKLVDREPYRVQNWLDVAPVLVMVGDEAAYRDFCRRMVQEYVDTKDLEAAEAVCRACLLWPGAIDIDQLPRNTLVQSPQDGSLPDDVLSGAWSTRALVAYRSGDASSALRYLEESPESTSRSSVEVMSLAVRALAQQELGQLEEARSAADRAELIVRGLQQTTGNEHEPLIPQILLREAQSLLDEAQ